MKTGFLLQEASLTAPMTALLHATTCCSCKCLWAHYLPSPESWRLWESFAQDSTERCTLKPLLWL